MSDFKPALILLVEADSVEAALLASGLERWNGCRVLSIADMQTALARIAGGGVELVVASLSGDVQTELAEWEAIFSLRRHAPQLPVVVLCAPGKGGDLIGSVGSDRNLRIVERNPDTDLTETVRNTLAHRRGRLGTDERRARIIALEGVKGGVGTTTLALNIAAQLARHGPTILAEMRLCAGTLSSYFGLPRRTRTIGDLSIHPKAIAAEDVDACLWRCDRVPGLTILFGPQSLQGREDIKAEHVDQILHTLAESAEHVVVDLPHCFSTMNRAVLGASDCFLLVLERDLMCLQAGTLVVRGLQAENLLPQSAGSVVVNRVPLAAPAELPEIESTLGVPIMGIIPPAADLCLRAHKLHLPVVALDPESMLAESIVHLAESLPSRAGSAARPALPQHRV